MIDALIRWSVGNRLAVLSLAVLLTFAGTLAAIRMPVDVFPDLTAPTVTVITEAAGMAPTEVESQVTFPIEASLNGAPGVRRVRSSTAVGLSVIWVEFDWGTDILAARQVVAEKVNLAAGDLLPEAGRPSLAPIASIMGEILFLSLTSDRHGPMDLRTTAEATVRRRLLAVPGVAQVTPIGGEEKQYQAILDPERLRAHGITLEDAAEALSAANRNVSAGFLVAGGSEYLVSGIGRIRSTEDIAETMVDRPGGVPVRMADIGAVRIGGAPKRGEASAMGRPAVILGVQKQPGINTLALTRKLDRVLDDLEAELPLGMRIDREVFRQSDFIEIAVRNVEAALRDGAILVVAIVFVFLANSRAALITLTAIPLSLLASVLVLQALGATINTMTLGGMTIAIGALVDDAIIDVENVVRRLRENALAPTEGKKSPSRIVVEATVEVRTSIVFATLIIVLVFLPIFFLPGVEGRLLKPLGMAYVAALAASLVVAISVTPALSSLLLPSSKAVREGRQPRVVGILRSAYARILGPTLKHPWLVATPSALLLAAAVAASAFLGRSFLPEFNEGALSISAVTLPGTSLAESDSLGRLAEEAILSHPEVTSVARRTGRAELDEHAMGVESAEIDVSYRLRERSRAEFLAALRGSLSLVPGMNFILGQPISHRIDHMLSGTRASIAVKIFGEDLHRLRALAERAREAMGRVPGVVDLSVEQQADVPILKVRLDRAALARHGISVAVASRALEAAFKGITVTRVLEGRNSFDLVVRLSGSDDWTAETLRDLPLDAPGGVKVPLDAVADIAKDFGPNSISREGVERKIVVMCNAAGRDVTAVVRDTKRAVDPIIGAVRGYRVEYGGQFEAASTATRTLAYLGVAVILGIGFLLHVAFGSARDAMLIMINLPLALIGGVAGVFVSGGVLSVASLIGFITVFGIAARNGIMLVSHIRYLQEREGVTDFREAVFRGSMERVAPILMTSLATGLALIPLVLGGGKPGSEIQTPMAMVILFGLLTSMLLNMVVVPTLYLYLGRPVSRTQGGEP